MLAPVTTPAAAAAAPSADDSPQTAAPSAAATTDEPSEVAAKATIPASPNIGPFHAYSLRFFSSNSSSGNGDAYNGTCSTECFSGFMLLTSPAIGPLDDDVAHMEIPLCSKYFGACAAATDARPAATDVGLAATASGFAAGVTAAATASGSAAGVTAGVTATAALSAGVPSAGASPAVPHHPATQPPSVASGSVRLSPLGALAFSPQQVSCDHTIQVIQVVQVIQKVQFQFQFQFQ
ncbi:unnamed protein product, partial [Closterium sp. NIES-54]